MRKILFYGIIILLLVAVIDGSQAYIFKGAASEGTEAEVLLRTLEASGMDVLTSNVFTSLHLPDAAYTMEELDAMVDHIMTALKFEGEIINLSHQEYYPPLYEYEGGADFEKGFNRIYIERQEDIGTKQILATKVDEMGNTTVLKLYSAAWEDIKESYIIIDIVQNKRYKDIGAIIKENKTLLQEFGDTIETTATITAVSPGKKTGAENQKLMNKLIEASGAIRVDEAADDHYHSVTLYTPAIDWALAYNGKRVNLQLATRYNDYEKKTYLWIATPLITNTY